jgi:hypothetical protein
MTNARRVTPVMLHHASSATLNVPAAALFDYLDDFRKLSAHMEKPSPMMLGSRMAIEMDGANGRAIGSTVRMSGRILGMPLELKEVVIERTPPVRKTWRTVDANLLVIGAYTLGFQLEARGLTTHLLVFIDYLLPETAAGRWLGRLLARRYARWCTERMVKDAMRHFSAA